VATTDTETRTAGEGTPELAVVDCDVHPHWRNGFGDLEPYLSEAWKKRLGIGHAEAWAKEVYASHVSVPKNVLYANPVGVMRRDTVPEDGSVPCGDPAFVAGDHLDALGIDRAILVGGSVLGLGGLPDADLASVVASAHNDWLSEVWLEADPRYRGSLVVAPQDPQQAAAEIDRAGDRPGFVQVQLPLLNVLMGDRYYFPIYEAAERHGLPVAVHPNSIDGIFAKGPTLAGGVYTYYTEWHTALSQVFHGNTISLVCQGVFERFPGLKIVICEGGVAWLLDVMWRLDKDWRSLRDEVPWLTRLPSEYIVDHVRLTTQPFVEPEKRSHLHALLEIVHAEKTLLYSSDYPHWDFDHPERALAGVPDETRSRVLSGNARDLYGDRLL
jgi:predicted TIM-barrel fold metal-dependent hydrolase